jgi:TP901 family phage tail tape measure protein
MASSKGNYNPKITITVKVDAKELKKLDNKVTDSFDKGKTKAKGFFDYMKRAGNAVFGGFFGKIGGMMASSLTRAFRKAGEEFLKLDTTIRKTMGLLSEQEIKKLGGIDGLKSIAKELSNTFGTDSSLISQNIFDAISLGAEKSTESIKGILTTAEKLGKAADVESNTLVQAIQGITNTYTEFAGNAASVGDTMYLAMKRGAGELSNYADGMKNVAATAKLANVDMNQLAALGSALSTTTKNVNVAFTQTDAVLTALIKPAKQSRDMLALINKEAGTNIKLGSDALKDQDLVTYLESLKNAAETAGISWDKVIAKMFSRKQAMKGVSAFIGESGKTFKQTFEEMNEAATNSGVVIEEAFAKMADSPKMTLDKLKQQLQNTFVDIIEQLFPLFEKLVPTLERLLPVIGNIGTAIAGLLDSAPIKLFLNLLSGASSILAGLFAPAETAKQKFDDLYNSIQNNQTALRGLATVQFNKEIIDNEELLKQKIDEVNAVAPELAEKLRLISEASLESSEKVKLMNAALQDFKSINLTATLKDQKKALIEFSRGSVDIVDSYNVVATKIRDLEKNIGKLNEKQRIELLDYRKQAQRIKDEFQIEAQKLITIGVDQDLIKSEFEKIYAEFIDSDALKNIWTLGLNSGDAWLTRDSFTELFSSIGVEQKELKDNITGMMNDYLNLLKQSNNLQDVNNELSNDSLLTLGQLQGFTEEQNAELEKQLVLKKESLALELENLKAKQENLRESGLATKARELDSEIAAMENQIELIRSGLENLHSIDNVDIKINLEWVEAKKNLSNLKNSLSELEKSREVFSGMDWIPESTMKMIDNGIKNITEKLIEAQDKIQDMKKEVTTDTETALTTTQPDEKQYFKNIEQSSAIDVKETERNLQLVEATYRLHLQKINDMTIENEELKNSMILQLEEQKNNKINDLLGIGSEESQQRTIEMMDQVNKVIESGLGDEQRIQLEAILEQEEKRLAIIQQQSEEMEKQVTEQIKEKYDELAMLEDALADQLDAVSGEERESIKAVFEGQKEAIYAEIQLLESTINSVGSATNEQNNLVDRILGAIDDIKKTQKEIEKASTEEVERQKKFTKERTATMLENYDEREKQLRRQSEELRKREEAEERKKAEKAAKEEEERLKKEALEANKRYEEEQKRRTESAADYIESTYESQDQLVSSMRSTMDEFNQIYGESIHEIMMLDEEIRDDMIDAFRENQKKVIESFAEESLKSVIDFEITDEASIEQGFNMLDEYNKSVSELAELMGKDIPKEFMETLEKAGYDMLRTLSQKMDEAYEKGKKDIFAKYGGAEYNKYRYEQAETSIVEQIEDEMQPLTNILEKQLIILNDNIIKATDKLDNTMIDIQEVYAAFPNEMANIYDEYLKKMQEVFDKEALLSEYKKSFEAFKKLAVEQYSLSASGGMLTFLEELKLVFAEDLKGVSRRSGDQGIIDKLLEILEEDEYTTTEEEKKLLLRLQDLVEGMGGLTSDFGGTIDNLLQQYNRGTLSVDIQALEDEINILTQEIASAATEQARIELEDLKAEKEKEKAAFESEMELLIERAKTRAAVELEFQDMQKAFNKSLSRMELVGYGQLDILKAQLKYQKELVEQKKKGLIQGVTDVELEQEIVNLKLEEKRIVEEIAEKELELALKKSEYLGETEYAKLEIQKEYLQSKADELELELSAQNEINKNKILMEVLSRKHTQEELDAAYEKMAILDEEYKQTEEYMDLQIQITEIQREQAQTVANTITSIGSALWDAGKSIMNLFDVFDEGTKAMVEGVLSAAQQITGSIGQALGDSVAGIVFQALSAIIGIIGEIYSAAYEHKVKRLMEEGNENLEKAKEIHEEINKIIEKRNDYLELAKKLRLESMDTLEEEIEYIKETIRLLEKKLELEGMSNNEIADQASQTNSYVDALTHIMNDLIDYNESVDNWRDTDDWLKSMDEYLKSMGLSWEQLGIDIDKYGTHLTTAEREALIGEIQARIDALIESQDDINLLLDAQEQLQELIKQQVKEQYDIKRLQAELEGDITGSYDAQISYILEMLKRADEFNLSTLEKLELEQQLNDLYEQRFDSILEQYDKEMELYLLRAKLEGASEEELQQLELERINNLIAAKELEIEQLGSTIDRELELAKLEEERLKLQQEINGELADQGILLDKNVQRIIQQIINTRLLGDLEAEAQSIEDAISVLQAQGYTNQEISDLLGIDLASIPGVGGGSAPIATGGLPTLPNFDISEDIRKSSMEAINQLSELKTQTALLSEQNSLLRTMLGIQSKSAKQTQRITASGYHRSVKTLNEISYQ